MLQEILFGFTKDFEYIQTTYYPFLLGGGMSMFRSSLVRQLRRGGSYASVRTEGTSTNVKRKARPSWYLKINDDSELLPDLTSTSKQQKPLTANMAEQLVLRGTLEGHSGWVTSLATSLEKCASTKSTYSFSDGETDMRPALTCFSRDRATRP